MPKTKKIAQPKVQFLPLKSKLIEHGNIRVGDRRPAVYYVIYVDNDRKFPTYRACLVTSGRGGRIGNVVEYDLKTLRKQMKRKAQSMSQEQEYILTSRDVLLTAMEKLLS